MKLKSVVFDHQICDFQCYGRVSRSIADMATKPAFFSANQTDSLMRAIGHITKGVDYRAGLTQRGPERLAQFSWTGLQV